VARVWSLRRAGMTVRAIADKLGRSRGSVEKILMRYPEKGKSDA